ncbi:MAG: serine hydrolase [Pyrinomonadaceae bacterium]|nr:serine hydrolase [Pyrinomonadaceae bacterium]
MKTKKMTKLSAQIIFVFVFSISVFAQGAYFPSAENWETKNPQNLKIDAAKLKEAIDFAIANEAKAPRDQELSQLQSFGREPFGEIIGPTKTRGEMTGIIIKNGYIVAEWGEVFRVDMTHSVTKSFLSTVVGLAFDRKLIRDLNAPVYKEMAPISVYNSLERFDDAERFGKSKFLELFDTEHNKKIRWNDLLTQSSDWEGTLWGKPDWADRPDRDANNWLNRKRNEPETVYEYNDTRVNLLALCALNIWRKPLPQVLKENLMDEIGASATWRWFGYENSYVLIDGQIMQSVSGGGHWGGGMFINARDMARFGLLVERNGKWNDKQIISTEFLKRAETPSAGEPTYGFMNFFLNTNKKLYPSAPEGTLAFLGNGTNIVYIDRKNDLVVVARWIENNKIDEFLGKVIASLEEGAASSN